MAGVQGSALAAVVSNVGGLGLLPYALLTLESVRTELAAVMAQTDQPFNENFFLQHAITAQQGAGSYLASRTFTLISIMDTVLS